MQALIIDDSRPIRRIESDILKELGFETADAANGKQALEMLQASPVPDVVLVDWNMPEMDGLEFIRSVRGNDRYSDMVVLMVTTETESDQMLRAERRRRRIPHEAFPEGRSHRQIALGRSGELACARSAFSSLTIPSSSDAC